MFNKPNKNHKELNVKTLRPSRKTIVEAFKLAEQRIIRDNKSSSDKYGRPSKEDMDLPITE